MALLSRATRSIELEAGSGARWARVLPLVAVAASLLCAAQALADDPKHGCMELEGLPDDAWVEMDGSPLDISPSCVPVATGTYLVTVFSLTAPPLELFVEVRAGEVTVVEYERPRLRVPPVASLGSSLHSQQGRPASLGPAVVGGAVVSGLGAGVLWTMSHRSSLAAEQLISREDLDEGIRDSMLDDVKARGEARRERALVTAGLAGALLVTGAAIWAWESSADESRGARAGVNLQGGADMLGLTVSMRWP